ncbi:alpha/beta hydrolase [Agromyces archimandritae]|uniref:Alpha/beta hydrolase n=1 Tax=Agromyces archimandritae TaxID=2781962 RepID=A0A975IMZ3_9MICO|nr:alpha/beta hydrolase [Agromyces archimandritae]QTX04057.1 alpha/beta hydrolase [Agromyces archimandritae]
MTEAAGTARPRRAGRRIAGVLIALAGVLVLVIVAFAVWAHILYPGERAASLDAWRDPAIRITETEASFVIEPTDPDHASGDGLVFLPGARVEPSAYLAKLRDLAGETGATVVITKPTLNLAFFDTRPLSAFIDGIDDVDRWFVGGHSLGGVKACMLAEDPAVAGLVLLGSYCANDLSGTDLAVVQIAASEDRLSSEADLAAAAHLLPPTTALVEIDGANHASFGDYGVQPGDGVATASDDEVRAAITRAWVAVTG